MYIPGTISVGEQPLKTVTFFLFLIILSIFSNIFSKKSKYLIIPFYCFKTFPNLKKSKFWGSGLWSKGYYVGTAGAVSSEIIVKYIQNQKS